MGVEKSFELSSNLPFSLVIKSQSVMMRAAACSLRAAAVAFDQCSLVYLVFMRRHLTFEYGFGLNEIHGVVKVQLGCRVGSFFNLAIGSSWNLISGYKLYDLRLFGPFLGTFHSMFLDVFHPSPPLLLSGSRLSGGVTRYNRIIITLLNIAHVACVFAFLGVYIFRAHSAWFQKDQDISLCSIKGHWILHRSWDDY